MLAAPNPMRERCTRRSQRQHAVNKGASERLVDWPDDASAIGSAAEVDDVAKAQGQAGCPRMAYAAAELLPAVTRGQDLTLSSPPPSGANMQQSINLVSEGSIRDGQASRGRTAVSAMRPDNVHEPLA